MATFTLRVQATADNALERSDDTNFTTDPTAALGAGINAGRSGAGGSPFWYSGHRFNAVTIPQGTTITSAIVTFTGQSITANSPMTVAVHCENVDSAANFTTTADVVNRARTTASSSWNPPQVQAVDGTYDTADITSAVQEVINRAGWASGNALMVLCITNAGTDGDSSRSYYYADSTTKCALLTINYVSAGGLAARRTLLGVGV